MIVSAIAAMDRSGIIGDGEKMSWHLPRDLKRFREYTWGKPVIMGRRTLDSLHAPLPGRLNIVLSHNRLLEERGFRVAGSVDEALGVAADHLAEIGGQEAMIIGGGMVYEATSRIWDRLLLTVVEGKFRGITRFPMEQAQKVRWKLIDRRFYRSDSKNPHPHWFVELRRVEDQSKGELCFDLASWLGETSGPVAELPIGCG
jgi:dihydrofolate reductase